jgi:hypothetical protein
MQRDRFTLEVNHVDWAESGGEPRRPTVVIDVEGPDGEREIRERLASPDGDLLDADETDVAFRLTDERDRPDDANGVVGVTDRLTGDFVLELNETAEDVFEFIHAARRYGEAAAEDGQYRVVIKADGEEIATYDKATFLVYTREGELLREHSLIPSGVEL